MSLTAKLSKRQLTAVWFEQHPAIALRCPHCQLPLYYQADCLLCDSQHRFDVNKQGTFFLANKSADAHYHRRLFEARRHVIQASPFYAALTQQLSELVKCAQQQAQWQQPVIVDAGAGEGSHLYRLCHKLPFTCTSIGLDLAKDGIRMASDYNGEQLALVADLAQLPLMNHSVQVILSIFSPVNYQEFQRILTEDGLVLKVIPNAGYLQELRTIMQQLGWSVSVDYENKATFQAFERHYPNMAVYLVQQAVFLNLTERLALVKMTPLTWHLTDEQQQKLAQKIPATITLDVTILTSRKLK